MTDNIRFFVLTATVPPISFEISSGVIMIAAIVDAVVMRTERATSAFAIIVTRFEAVPPGEHPTSMRPIANSTGRPQRILMLQARVGIMEY